MLLRPLDPSDAEALFAIFSDPRVMRYWSSAPWISLDQAHEMIAKDIEAHRTGSYLRLGIRLQESGDLIGMGTLYQFMPQCRRAELGYALAGGHWGRGYMREALTAILDYAFDVLDLNRVEADIDPRNSASARALERLGFVKEGHLRERWIVEGEVSDTGFYGLLRSDWRKR